MKLSQDILFFRLMLNYPVQILCRNAASSKFSYPVLYEAGTALSNHAVILLAGEFETLTGGSELGDALFICIGTPKKLPAAALSVIVIENNASPISVSNYLNKTYDIFEQWDNSMKSVVFDSGSFQALIDCCDPIIVEPIAIMDREFQCVAFSEISTELGYNKSVEDDNRLSLDAFNNFMTEVNYAKICEIRETYLFSSTDGHCLGRNIFGKDEFAGRIAIFLSTNEDYLENYSRAVLEHFYPYADKLFSKYLSFDVREIKKSSLASLLQDSLDKKQIPEKLWEEALKENKWSKTDPLQLLQFKPNPRKAENLHAKYLSSKLDKIWPDCICFTYMDHVLLLTNRNKFNDPGKLSFFQALAYFLRDNLLTAGVSREFTGRTALRSAYEQTETALEFGIRRDPATWYYKFDDYALDYMIHACKGLYKAEEICSWKLTTLRQYDADKGTEYYKTLLTYSDCQYNAAEAAKRLFINRSTLHYRLDRIQSLVKVDFSSNDECLYLELSFRLLEQR